MWVREVVPARDRLDAEDDDTGVTPTHADRARRGGAVRAASSLSSQEGVWIGLIQKDSEVPLPSLFSL